MSTLRITCNGRPITTAAPDLAALVEEQWDRPGPEGVAVAVDGAVVPRSAWSATALESGADVEIVTAVQGG